MPFLQGCAEFKGRFPKHSLYCSQAKKIATVGNGKFLDQDKAWISSSHGKYLSKHSAKPMDLLIASLGDEIHPFGRACLYTDYVHEAIVKADR